MLDWERYVRKRWERTIKLGIFSEFVIQVPEFVNAWATAWCTFAVQFY
jgi:hypothetical protein